MEKLPTNAAQDAEWLDPVEDVRAEYDDLLASLPAYRRGEEAVREIRWMIEEFRVSLFAQDLRAAHLVAGPSVPRHGRTALTHPPAITDRRCGSSRRRATEGVLGADPYRRAGLAGRTTGYSQAVSWAISRRPGSSKGQGVYQGPGALAGLRRVPRRGCIPRLQRVVGLRRVARRWLVPWQWLRTGAGGWPGRRGAAGGSGVASSRRGHEQGGAEQEEDEAEHPVGLVLGQSGQVRVGGVEGQGGDAGSNPARRSTRRSPTLGPP